MIVCQLEATLRYPVALPIVGLPEGGYTVEVEILDNGKLDLTIHGVRLTFWPEQAEALRALLVGSYHARRMT